MWLLLNLDLVAEGLESEFLSLRPSQVQKVHLPLRARAQECAIGAPARFHAEPKGIDFLAGKLSQLSCGSRSDQVTNGRLQSTIETFISAECLGERMLQGQ